MMWAQIYETASGLPVGPVHGFGPKETLPALPEGQAWLALPGSGWMVGASPEGAVAAVEVPPPSLDRRKQAAWDAVKAQAARQELCGAPTPKGRVQIDARSQDIIGNLALAATRAQMADAAWSIVYTMADNNNIEHDAGEMIALAEAAMARAAAIHAQEQALRAAIEAAEDEAALEAIDITEGWPA
jgi:hypothetical protein